MWTCDSHRLAHMTPVHRACLQFKAGSTWGSQGISASWRIQKQPPCSHTYAFIVTILYFLIPSSAGICATYFILGCSTKFTSDNCRWPGLEILTHGWPGLEKPGRNTICNIVECKKNIENVNLDFLIPSGCFSLHTYFLPSFSLHGSDEMVTMHATSTTLAFKGMTLLQLSCVKYECR